MSGGADGALSRKFLRTQASPHAAQRALRFTQAQAQAQGLRTHHSRLRAGAANLNFELNHQLSLTHQHPTTYLR